MRTATAILALLVSAPIPAAELGVSVGSSRYDIDRRSDGRIEADAEDMGSVGLHALSDDYGVHYGLHYVHHGTFTLESSESKDRIELQAAAATIGYATRHVFIRTGPTIWTAQSTHNGNPERTTKTGWYVANGMLLDVWGSRVELGLGIWRGPDIQSGRDYVRRFYVATYW